MSAPNLYEILTVTLAHDLKDGEVGFTGLTTGNATARFATSIPLAAAELARRTHAPNLTIMLSGSFHNPNLSRLTALPDSEFDEDLRDLECEAQSKGYPNHPGRSSAAISTLASPAACRWTDRAISTASASAIITIPAPG